MGDNCGSAAYLITIAQNGPTAARMNASGLQPAFGSFDEQQLCNYDVHCDGRVNAVDSGIVQSLLGTSDPPRGSCPKGVCRAG